MVNYLSICMSLKTNNLYNVSQEYILSRIRLLCGKSFKFVPMCRRHSASLHTHRNLVLTKTDDVIRKKFRWFPKYTYMYAYMFEISTSLIENQSYIYDYFKMVFNNTIFRFRLWLLVLRLKGGNTKVTFKTKTSIRYNC